MKFKSKINHLLIWIGILGFVLLKAAKGYTVSWNEGLSYVLSFIVLLGVFYALNQRFIPKLFNGNKNQFIKILLLVLFAFLALELIWGMARIREYYERYYMFFSWKECFITGKFEGVEQGFILGSLITAVAIPFIISLWQRMMQGLKSGKKVSSILNVVISVILILMIGTQVKILVSDSFKKYVYPNEVTNSQIQFLEVSNDISSIGEIIKECGLESKPTYVSLWTTGCAWLKYPVMLDLEFMKTDSLRDQMNFLYICGETVLSPSDREFWKQNIDSYGITGAHVYLEKELFERVFVEQYEEKYGTAYGYSLFFEDQAILKLDKAPRANKSEKDELKKLLESISEK